MTPEQYNLRIKQLEEELRVKDLLIVDLQAKLWSRTLIANALSPKYESPIPGFDCIARG